MKTQKILLILVAIVFSLHSYSQVQTQDLNMGLYQLQFPSANGGNNRIQSYGGSFPGKWEFKSRFDDIHIDAGENSSNTFRIFFKTGGIERARFDSNGNFGIGTTNPIVKLDVENGDLYVGQEVNANGMRREMRVYGFDNNNKFFGSLHSNYDDNRRTFDINSNDQTEQIKIDASANAYASIILNPGVYGNVGIGTANPLKKLSVNGDILLENASGIKQIFTWSPSDTNWRIGMNENPGFNRSILTSHVQFLTYGTGVTQGFAVGVNGGDSSLEIRGSDHTAFFRGNVGIGTITPDSKLTVAGKIHSQEVKVTINAGADFVFNEDYNLPTLKSIETFIKKNKHLPEIASEKDMQENGLYLAEMNIKLLQKIEELTLYTINQEKRIETLEKENKNLITQEERMTQLEEKIARLLNTKK